MTATPKIDFESWAKGRMKECAAQISSERRKQEQLKKQLRASEDTVFALSGGISGLKEALAVSQDVPKKKIQRKVTKK